MRIGKQALFAVFGTGNCSIQDPSTNARDDNVKFNQIPAQAKPRFCASALNLRGSALAGKVKAVRVLQWCAPKSAPPRKTPNRKRASANARFGWGFLQITENRRRQLAEIFVNLL